MRQVKRIDADELLTTSSEAMRQWDAVVQRGACRCNLLIGVVHGLLFSIGRCSIWTFWAKLRLTLVCIDSRNGCAVVVG